MQRKFAFVVILFLSLLMYGCGEDNSKDKGNTSVENKGTLFTGYVPGKRSTSTDNNNEETTMPSEEKGIEFVVRQKNIRVPSDQVGVIEQQAFIYLGGSIDVDNVTYSINFTFIKAVSYPHTYNLVTGRPQSQDDAVFFYQESVSGGTVKTIQKVKDGLLVIKKLNNREIIGGFWARIGLDNGEDLYIHNGTINLER